MKTCIFTLIKDELDYLNEFIQYHLNLGIDHIIIGEDYNSMSHKEITDKYPKDKVTLLSVLDFFEKEKIKQRIIYEKTHQFNLQNQYIINGLKYIKKNYTFDWCFVIDCDEYITLEDKTKTLEEILSQYNEYDAVVLQWENYGANGLIHKPNYKEKGIIDTYTKKCNFQNVDAEYWYQTLKTVYNMNHYTNICMSDHVPILNSKWCKTNFTQNIKEFLYDNIYIRHYITKSWDEYVAKLKIRGMFTKSHRNYESFFEMNTDMIPLKNELMKTINEQPN